MRCVDVKKEVEPAELKWIPAHLVSTIEACDDNSLICKPHCIGCLSLTRINKNGAELVEAGCIGSRYLNIRIGALRPSIRIEKMNEVIYKPGLSLTKGSGKGYIKVRLCDETGCNNPPTSTMAPTTTTSGANTFFNSGFITVLFSLLLKCV